MERMDTQQHDGFQGFSIMYVMYYGKTENCIVDLRFSSDPHEEARRFMDSHEHLVIRTAPDQTKEKSDCNSCR